MLSTSATRATRQQQARTRCSRPGQGPPQDRKHQKTEQASALQQAKAWVAAHKKTSDRVAPSQGPPADTQTRSPDHFRARAEAELRARGRIKPAAGSHDSFDDIPAADYDGAKVSRRESERSRR